MTKSGIRVLFVDDSPSVIDMLKRMVHSQDSDWDVRYAVGGVEAIGLLDLERFDVIVTDLQMPEIDGVKLLKYVQKSFPELIRIIFSASLTKDAVREVASFTHRFISKPCGVEQLAQTIENTIFIHRQLDNKQIQKVLTKTTTIPSLPKIYQELMKRIDDEDFSLRDAGHLISSDIGMSANILKQINLLGYGSEISSVEQAVSFLGLNCVKAIALSNHIFNTVSLDNIPNFSLEDLVRHSMLTAEFAKTITLIETDDRTIAESAFVAGVLHDMGAIVLAMNFPKKYGDVLSRVYKAHRPIAEVERNLIGTSHGEIAAHILALWGFPDPILTAVAFHEDPLNRSVESFSILTAVYAGSILAHIYDGDNRYSEEVLENSLYLQQLNCASRLSLWEEQCKKIYSKLSD